MTDMYSAKIFSILKPFRVTFSARCHCLQSHNFLELLLAA